MLLLAHKALLIIVKHLVEVLVGDVLPIGVLGDDNAIVFPSTVEYFSDSTLLRRRRLVSAMPARHEADVVHACRIWVLFFPGHVSAAVVKGTSPKRIGPEETPTR